MIDRSRRVLKHLLDKPQRARIEQEWKKAGSRLKDDPDGAITSARTMLETVCKYILDGLGKPYAADGDLPKLYGHVADGLSLGAGKATGDINKRFFGSVHTIIQAVGELRNRVGDAHGRSGAELHVSQSQAELAVSLSEAMTKFLLVAFDAHIGMSHRLASDGQAILKFDVATVWRLVDHARNAPLNIPSDDDEEDGPAPALWLVGDAGIYLMSNGKPPILETGKIVSAEEAGFTQKRLCVYAEGCGPENDVDEWWPIHSAIEGGDDFSRTLPTDFILFALEEAQQYIVILASPDETEIMSDLSWKERGETLTDLH